jgi:hypothetical protein
MSEFLILISHPLGVVVVTIVGVRIVGVVVIIVGNLILDNSVGLDVVNDLLLVTVGVSDPADNLFVLFLKLLDALLELVKLSRQVQPFFDLDLLRQLLR